MANKELLMLSDRIKRNPDLLFSKIDDEIVLFSEINNSYFNLNLTGSLIWEMIPEPIAISTVISQLVERYSADKRIIENDVLSYLEPLIDKGIILKL